MIIGINKNMERNEYTATITFLNAQMILKCEDNILGLAAFDAFVDMIRKRLNPDKIKFQIKAEANLKDSIFFHIIMKNDT